MNSSERPLRRTAALALLAGLAAAAHAQSPKPAGYPAKPVRLLVAYPAGGSADLMTRVLAQKLGERIGQQVIVDNRPGAAGNIGVEVVAKSPADRKSTRLNSSHSQQSRMPSSA